MHFPQDLLLRRGSALDRRQPAPSGLSSSVPARRRRDVRGRDRRIDRDQDSISERLRGQLSLNHRVPEALWQQAVGTPGEQRVIVLTVLSGTIARISMLLNATQVGTPGCGTPPLEELDPLKIRRRLLALSLAYLRAQGPRFFEPEGSFRRLAPRSRPGCHGAAAPGRRSRWSWRSRRTRAALPAPRRRARPARPSPAR